jgi:hypothetical protein
VKTGENWRLGNLGANATDCSTANPCQTSPAERLPKGMDRIVTADFADFHGWEMSLFYPWHPGYPWFNSFR